MLVFAASALPRPRRPSACGAETVRSSTPDAALDVEVLTMLVRQSPRVAGRRGPVKSASRPHHAGRS